MSLLPAGTSEAVTRRLSTQTTALIDPAGWIRGRLDEDTWSGQQKILHSLKTHRKTAVKSCHGIGKSYTASRAGAWWIDSHPAGEAFVISSAPSQNQVRNILWGELAKAHRRGGLDGYITRGQVPEWVIDSQVVGFGRKPADFVDPDEARTQFQGIHARFLLVMLDEACGVPQWLWEASETLVTNEASRILAIGNPDDPTSYFEKICRPGSGWNVLEFSAFDTPNFTGEPVSAALRDLLVSPLWVEERRREWGEESPLYISKVLGQFPEVADDVIISPKLVREAHERDLSGNAISDAGRFGMDVARYGEDETCIYRNRGGMIRLEQAWRKADTDISRARAQLILEADPWRHMQIDVVGLGAGVYDPLNNQGFNVSGYSGGEAAHDPGRFANRNAEAWWSFREGLEQGLIDLDPDDDLLAAQLQARKWRLDTSQRRIRIETKDEMAKRGLKSPDRADAAILSWYESARTVDDINQLIRRDPGEATMITHGLLDQKT